MVITMHKASFFKERECKAEEERIRTENLLKGNPLLNQDKGGFKIKRRCVHNECYIVDVSTIKTHICRWDDDVVFKNCARGEEERKVG